MDYYIASVSWGKDSLYMLLRLIEEGAPLNEVAFFDTGMEFQEIYDTRDRVLPLLAAHGIKYTEFQTKRPFLYDMLEKPVNGKNGFHIGYSWCGGCARWGTAGKQQALDANAKKYSDQGYSVFQYVGIAADEPKRLERLPPQKPPLRYGASRNLNVCKGAMIAVLNGSKTVFAFMIYWIAFRAGVARTRI